FVEHTDQVLSGLTVDAGLPAYRRIDHARKRGRHVDQPNPAHPGRGNEARQVGHRTAAETDDHTLTVQTDLAEYLPAEVRHTDRLTVLGVRHFDSVRIQARS